jgi:3-oxoacyl-[acyl-carrier protein] reductase
MNNRCVLVTGANRGIGLAIAKKFKENDGYTVVATARKDEDIAMLNDLGFTSLRLDVRDDDSIQNLLGKLKESGLRPSILINNAGVARLNLSVKISDSEWDDVLSTNLTSVFKISKLLLSAMARNKFGRIINISSVLGTMPQKGFAHYAASKAAMEGLTRVLALEYASKGVTVNCIAPGFVKTSMLETIGESGVDMMESSIPVGYAATPEDIASLAYYLAQPEARYITGEVIHINGGLYFN